MHEIRIFILDPVDSDNDDSDDDDSDDEITMLLQVGFREKGRFSVKYNSTNIINWKLERSYIFKEPILK